MDDWKGFLVAMAVVFALAVLWALAPGGDASGPGDLGRCDVGAQTRWC